MRYFLSLLAVATLISASTINTKSVGCEVQENVEKAYYLWEHNGSKGFIKFMTLHQCELLHVNAKLKIVDEEGSYYKVTPVNLRELWVKKEVVTK